MSDLKAEFEAKSDAVQELSSDPGNEAKLSLYALYKQATKGDADGKRPGRLNMVARAKWDAWNEKSGMSTEDAMQAYIDLVSDLQAKD